MTDKVLDNAFRRTPDERARFPSFSGRSRRWKILRIVTVLGFLFFCFAVTNAEIQNPAHPALGADTSNQKNDGSRPRNRKTVPIRALLIQGPEVQLNCHQGPYSVWDRNRNRLIGRLEKNRPVRLSRKDGSWRLEDLDGISIQLHDTALEADLTELEFRPEAERFLAVGREAENVYRGSIRCVSRTPDSFAVVNVLDIEDYLMGVLGAEMPAEWHLAALRAQSIAARTYALYYRNRNRRRDWDIGSTQASQMYRGVHWENHRTVRAVRETSGLVLAYGPADREELFPAYFSSICGGHTQDAEPFFGLSLEPLKGGSCPHCREVAPPGRFQWPEVTIDKNQARKLLRDKFPSLARLEGITKIKIVEQSPCGRLERVELVGPKGRRSRISAEDLRLALYSSDAPLLSSWCKLHDAGTSWRFDQGYGWGHGVGLCQYGAQQMARLGRESVDILQHYYPQAVLLRAYEK